MCSHRSTLPGIEPGTAASETVTLLPYGGGRIRKFKTIYVKLRFHCILFFGIKHV